MSAAAAVSGSSGGDNKSSSDGFEWFAKFMSRTWQDQASADAQTDSKSATKIQSKPATNGWSGPLTADQLKAAEQKFGCTFPVQYRQFLLSLHSCTVKPTESRTVEPSGGAEESRADVPVHWLSDWTWNEQSVPDDSRLERRFEQPLSGLLRDIKTNDFWCESWGDEPASLPAKLSYVRERLQVGGSTTHKPVSRLIPIYFNRFVFSADANCQAVIRVDASDIAVVAHDFHRWLIKEFHVPTSDQPARIKPLTAEQEAKADELVQSIPFWGDLIRLFKERS